MGAGGAARVFKGGRGVDDAEFMAGATGLRAFVTACLWSLSRTRVGRAWAVLAGGGAALAGLASLVQASIV